MYSRHFYRIDEVKAALQLCIHRKRIQESIFWATELFDSQAFDSIQEVLFISWFYSIGLGNIEILYDIIDINLLDGHAILSIVYGMAHLKDSMRDCSLGIMFLNGISTNQYTNRNIYFEMPSILVQEDPLIDTFIRAVLLGKYIDAWTLFLSIPSPETVFEIYKKIALFKFESILLSELIDELQSLTLVSKWYIHCSIIAILSTYRKLVEQSKGSLRKIDDETNEKMKLYSSLYGKRKRRIFTIPKDCLYGKTKRGGMTYYDTNISELYDIDYIIENSCIIEEIEENFGSYESFQENTNEFDKFSDWYFPDDIPDEWSLEDQQKSHGYGVNQKTDKPILRRYITRWIDLKTNCKIWDKENMVNRAIEKISHLFEDFYFEQRIVNLYDTRKKKSDAWNLKSMKLILLSL